MKTSYVYMTIAMMDFPTPDYGDDKEDKKNPNELPLGFGTPKDKLTTNTLK